METSPPQLPTADPLRPSEKFYVASVSSELSTRDSSPARSTISKAIIPAEIPPLSSKNVDEPSVGLLPDEVYQSTMAWWRAAIRRRLLTSLKIQSELLGAMQTRVRSSWLDAYFVYTSSLGTHTFFMTLLPAIFFFGHDKTGQALVTVTGMGVYWTSFVKDLICCPRPFAPPVTRLTISNHHLEYGFPSTHSTNCISIVLYIHTLLYRYYLSDGISSTTLYAAQVALAWYAFSIVYGRLYCGMHSFSDVTFGATIGVVVWFIYWLSEDWLEAWLANTGWPAVIMINQHPQPVEDCPCFEDSIAFVASLVGVLIGQWHRHNFGLLRGQVGTNPVWDTWPTWLFYGALKLFFGILTIFAWRLSAKSLLHVILPPIYRAASLLVKLPNRRFYTPATDYEHVPRERGLFPIPSVISLPMTKKGVALAEADAWGNHASSREGLKLRNGNRSETGGEGLASSEKEKSVAAGSDYGNDGVPTGIGGESVHAHEAHGRKRYDADVLTKMIVYAGIGWIASEGGPVAFELLNW